MVNCTIYYLISRSLQKECILAGKNAYLLQEIEMPFNEVKDNLDLLDISLSGKVTLKVGFVGEIKDLKEDIDNNINLNDTKYGIIYDYEVSYETTHFTNRRYYLKPMKKIKYFDTLKNAKELLDAHKAIITNQESKEMLAYENKSKQDSEWHKNDPSRIIF